jgi:hypothetical protein
MSIHYKGYDLEPSSSKLADSDEWMTSIGISKLSSGDWQHQPFDPTGTFKTKEEADSYSISIGKQIIDGKHPTCKLDF